jgi:hypothetical protein
MWTTIVLIIILGILAELYWAIIPIIVFCIGLTTGEPGIAVFSGLISFVCLYIVYLWNKRK